MSSRTSQWHSVSQVRGRGGKGRRLSPFPPAHRLIELHCAHRDYVLLLFPSRTYMFLPRVSRGWQEFTAQLPSLRPSAAGSLLSSTNSVSCRGNLVAKDDLDSACAAWRTMAQRRCVWFYHPLHTFGAAVRQALGRLGAARGSTPPWLHPPIHIPEPCFAWVHSVAGQQAAVVNS